MSDKKLLPADLDPRNPSYAYKNKYNEHVENTDQFNNYVKSTEVKKIFSGMLWGEGPAYIPHLDTLVWSDIPNNRMLKLSNDIVSEYKNPSNYCNGNTIDKEENVISCSHGGRCIYKTNDNLEVEVLVDSYNGKNLTRQMTYLLNRMIQFGLQIHLMVFYQIMRDILASKNMVAVMCFLLILN